MELPELGRRKFLRTLGGIFVAAAMPTKTYAFFGNILRPKLVEQIIPPFASEIITVMTVTLNGVEMLKAPIKLDFLSTDWAPKGDKIVYKSSPGDQGTIVYDPREGTIAYIHTEKKGSDMVLRVKA